MRIFMGVSAIFLGTLVGCESSDDDSGGGGGGGTTITGDIQIEGSVRIVNDSSTLLRDAIEDANLSAARKDEINRALDVYVERRGGLPGLPESTPGADVTVTLASDLNNDGRIEGNEVVTGLTDAEGRFSLSATVADGLPMIATFVKEGFSSNSVRFQDVAIEDSGGSMPALSVDVALKPLQELELVGTSFQNSDRDVIIDGLDLDSTGNVRQFDPVIEAEYFPGDFSDDQGNFLVSTTFAEFILEDGSGDPIEDLGSETAEIQIEIPRTTWNTLSDLEPGNGQIDVPLYFFDEESGEWVRHDETGWLNDGMGFVVPESSLASISDGSYQGRLYAVGDVDHFSTWNCDWPSSSTGCVAGRLLLPGGGPAMNVTIRGTGVTYNGSDTVTTDRNGNFRVRGPKSELEGEDVDGNGVTGETFRLQILVTFEGVLYDLGEFDLPTFDQSEGWSEIGDIILDEDKQLEVELCNVAGVVTSEGEPVVSAFIVGQDDAMPWDLAYELCFEDGQDCSPVAITDEQGRFSMTIPILLKLWLFGYGVVTESDGTLMVRTGERIYPACPDDEIQLELNNIFAFGAVSVDTSDGAVITWTPDLPGNQLVVWGTDGIPNWSIRSDGGFDQPVTFGVLPEGAVEDSPPVALVEGQTYLVSVSGEGVTKNGGQFFFSSIGSFIISGR